MKPSTAKAKGAATEQAGCDYLNANGVPYAERRHLKGAKDEGDVAGWPGVCVVIRDEEEL